MLWRNCFWRCQGSKTNNFVKFLLIQHSFLYFNCQYLIKGGSDPYKPQHFLKQCSENFQMKYVNCFNRLRFLAEVSTKLLKIHFYRQIKGHNSGRKLKNQTNDLIFSSTFSTLFVIFIFVFENNQNSFSCCPPFDPFWFVKFCNSQQKLPIWKVQIGSFYRK